MVAGEAGELGDPQLPLADGLEPAGEDEEHLRRGQRVTERVMGGVDGEPELARERLELGCGLRRLEYGAQVHLRKRAQFAQQAVGTNAPPGVGRVGRVGRGSREGRAGLKQKRRGTREGTAPLCCSVLVTCDQRLATNFPRASPRGT